MEAEQEPQPAPPQFPLGMARAAAEHILLIFGIAYSPDLGELQNFLGERFILGMGVPRQNIPMIPQDVINQAAVEWRLANLG